MSAAVLIRETCSRCGEQKTPADFFVDRSRVSGRRSVCKVCHGQRHRDYVNSPAGAVVAASVNKRYRTGARGRASAREWRKTYQRDPVKVNAGKVVYRAVRSGKLVRQPCEGCGGWPVEGHHEDYSKPLEVRWRCRPCHARLHAEGDHAR